MQRAMGSKRHHQDRRRSVRLVAGPPPIVAAMRPGPPPVCLLSSLANSAGTKCGKQGAGAKLRKGVGMNGRAAGQGCCRHARPPCAAFVTWGSRSACTGSSRRCLGDRGGGGGGGREGGGRQAASGAGARPGRRPCRRPLNRCLQPHRSSALTGRPLVVRALHQPPHVGRRLRVRQLQPEALAQRLDRLAVAEAGQLLRAGEAGGPGSRREQALG